MHASDSIKSIVTGQAVRFSLPRELITTDRVLQRWAVSVGSGLPAEYWDDQGKAKPPPLPDDVAIVVDQRILHAPPKTRDLVTRWYKTPNPVEVIAERLGCSPRTVYKMHVIALMYLRQQLDGAGNDQLRRMIRAIGS